MKVPTETFTTERVESTRPALARELRDDAIRYFDGEPFRLVDLVVERETADHAGRSEYRGTATYEAEAQ